MWRIARAASEPAGAAESEEALPVEPHPRVQIEEGLWYEVTYDKAEQRDWFDWFGSHMVGTSS